jgi:hypothetical protein
MNNNEIYNLVVSKGIPHTNHETDLYIPVTEETKKMVANHEYKESVTTFVNQRDGGLWYDIPFAYIPAWQKRGLTTG